MQCLQVYNRSKSEPTVYLSAGQLLSPIPFFRLFISSFIRFNNPNSQKTTHSIPFPSTVQTNIMTSMKFLTFISCLLLLSFQVSANSPMLITSPSVCLDDTECAGDKYCEPVNKSCTPRAGLGKSCQYFFQSTCKKGLYCTIGDICKRIVPRGGKCNVHEACGPWGVCDGIESGNSGKCVSAGPLKSFYGQSCESLHDCATLVNDAPRPPVTSPVECVTGVCRNPRILKKKAGEYCSRKKDLCDGRRGLVCKFNRYARRSVCQQKVTTEPVANRFCTIGSQYSMCFPQFGFPTTCAPNGFDGSGFFECQKKPELVGRGQLCGSTGAAFGKCKPGLSCEHIDQVDSIRGNNAYFSCVKIVGEGEACPDFTKTQCGPGLFCDFRVCRKGSMKINFVKYNGEGVRCAHRSCAPGLECEYSTRSCQKPIQVVKKGGKCFDSILVRRVSYYFSVNDMKIVSIMLVYFLILFPSFSQHITNKF